MAQPPDTNLLELRVAFHNAVSRFQDWTADVGEPKVKLCGRFCPISEVCHEVANLFTPVPEAILSILYKETHASDDILALKIDQTYRARHGDDAEDSHGFASGAVYLVSSGLMSACEFGSKLGSRDMNERDAFGWAVRSLRLYDWNPAVPDKPRFQVNGDSLTFRELCERAKKLDEPLPEVIKYDLYPLLGRAPDLQAKLRLNETYSVAATCLLEFMTGRERN